MKQYLQDVTLIAPAFHEGHSALNLLRAYRDQTVYAREFIILDGGSKDDTCEIIHSFSRQYPELKIHLIVDATCNRQHCLAPIARARNIAIQNAVTDIIAATDFGCSPEQDWLFQLTKPMIEGDEQAVCGYYTIGNDTPFLRKYANVFVPSGDSFLPSSRSIAFRKQVWKTVGGYPESSYTAEDTYFDMKILNAGYSFYHAPLAVVKWNLARDEDDLKKKLYQYGYGEGKLRIYKGRFLIRLLCLICPLLMIAAWIYKKGKIPIRILYHIYYCLTKGYLKGLWDDCFPNK